MKQKQFSELQTRISGRMHLVPVFSFVLLFFILLQPVTATAVSLSSSQIANYFNSRVGASFPNRMCTKFVEDSFVALGVKKPYLCCATKSRNTYCVSTSRTIPVGATVYFGNCGAGRCRGCGAGEFGHVGVYVGDGYFVHATGGKVQKTALSSSYWNSRYRGYGFNGGYTLTDDTAKDVCNCSTAAAGQYEVTTSGNNVLYIRSGHGTAFSRVGAIPNHTVVSVTKTDGTWGHVSYGGVSGLVSMSYLKRYNPVPVITFNVSDGQVLSGTCTLTGTITNLGSNPVLRCYVDNVETGSGSGGTEFRITFNSTLVSNGSHVIKVRLTNDNGHDVSVSRTVTVKNVVHVDYISSEEGDIYTTDAQIGATYTRTIEVEPSNADNQTILWESSDTSVALAEDYSGDGKTGLITVKGVGVAILTASSEDGNKKHSFLVKVTRTGDVLYGDIPTATGAVNGAVDSADLARMRTFVNGTAVPDDNQKTAADLNGDERINDADLELLRSYLVGEIHIFPVETMLKEIHVVRAPSKRIYAAGETITTDGILVDATYNNGTGKTISGWSITSGAVAAEGQTTVELSYTENGITRSAYYTISVQSPVGAIADGTYVSVKTSWAADALAGSKAGSYTYVWEPSGGKLSGNAKEYGTGTYLPVLPGAEKEGCILNGWYTPDGKAVSAGDTLSSDIVLTAHWKACTHTNTYKETLNPTEEYQGETITYCRTCGQVLSVSYTADLTSQKEDEKSTPSTEKDPSSEKTDPAQETGKDEKETKENQETEPVQKETRPTAVLPLLKTVDKSIRKSASDKDLKNSVFAPLSARAKKTGKTSVTLAWSKVSGASKYIVYGSKCARGNRYKKLKTLKKLSWTQKKLKKGTFYKYIVVAVNKSGRVLSVSKTIHTITTGGKYTNVRSIRLNKTKVTVKRKKTFRIKASVILNAAGRRQKVHRALAYESSNISVATVSKKGVVKGKKKGSCYIYVYAQNGIYSRIKVKVK